MYTVNPEQSKLFFCTYFSFHISLSYLTVPEGKKVLGANNSVNENISSIHTLILSVNKQSRALSELLDNAGLLGLN